MTENNKFNSGATEALGGPPEKYIEPSEKKNDPTGRIIPTAFEFYLKRADSTHFTTFFGKREI